MKILEIATWQDLATIYMKLGSLPDAEICTEKAKSIEFYSPGSWHTTGKYPLSKAVHERKEKQFFCMRVPLIHLMSDTMKLHKCNFYLISMTFF